MTLQQQAIDDLRRVIGFDRWCWPAADPHTLVPLSGIAEHDYGPALPRLLELEYSGGDYAAMDVVARRGSPAGSLNYDTGGDLARSPRWDEVLRQVGIGDEAVVACRDDFGCWGWIKAYRDDDDRPFAEADLEFLAAAAPHLGSLLRRSLVREAADAASDPMSPGVLLLDRELGPLVWTAEARAWLDLLPAAPLFAAWGIVPPVIYPVAALARSTANGARAGALERTVDGRWVAIQAAPFEADDGRIAVTFRQATPLETFDLLCRAYALTPRERDVVAALVSGLDTKGVTGHLFISRHTVQDHLKSVFQKVDVHSRRELVATFHGP